MLCRYSSKLVTLKKSHLPHVLVMQTRLVPARVAVQMHDFKVRKRLDEISVGHPKLPFVGPQL